LRLLIAALATTVTIAIYTMADTYADSRELTEFVQNQYTHSYILPPGIAEMESAIDAVVSHKYLVFGQARGRGTIYARGRTDDGSARYWMIEYFCVLEGDEWKLSDSGLSIHGRDLHERVKVALRKAKYTEIKR
jgi:hypothetical protein